MAKRFSQRKINSHWDIFCKLPNILIFFNNIEGGIWDILPWRLKKCLIFTQKIAKRLFLLSESFLKVSQKKFPSPCYKLGKKLTCCNYLDNQLKDASQFFDAPDQLIIDINLRHKADIKKEYQKLTLKNMSHTTTRNLLLYCIWCPP